MYLKIYRIIFNVFHYYVSSRDNVDTFGVKIIDAQLRSIKRGE